MLSSSFAVYIAEHKRNGPSFYKELAIGHKRFDYTMALLKRYMEDDFKILDIGTHIGVLPYLIKMTYLNTDIEAFDSRGLFIKEPCLERYKIKFYKQDLFDSKPEPKYDLVLLTEVLEHIKDYKRAFEIAANFTRRYLFVSVPNNSNHGLNKFKEEDIFKLADKYIDVVKILNNSKLKTWLFFMSWKEGGFQ